MSDSIVVTALPSGTSPRGPSAFRDLVVAPPQRKAGTTNVIRHLTAMFGGLE